MHTGHNKRFVYQRSDKGRSERDRCDTPWEKRNPSMPMGSLTKQGKRDNTHRPPEGEGQHEPGVGLVRLGESEGIAGQDGAGSVAVGAGAGHGHVALVLLETESEVGGTGSSASIRIRSGTTFTARQPS